MSKINYFNQIKSQLASLPKTKLPKGEEDFVLRYLGTSKDYAGVKAAEVIKIAKGAVKVQNDLSAEELIELLDLLFSSGNYEMHMIAGKIFTFISPQNRAKIPFSQLEKWLAGTHGWAELDVVCQSSYTAPEVLARWDEWEKTIKKFSASDNIQIRRASLVLQCVSARKSDDKRIQKLAFDTVERLKHEKPVLITKAVSWLLRCLVVQDKIAVKKYLISNESTLPRIAFRETMKKIETGKK